MSNETEQQSYIIIEGDLETLQWMLRSLGAMFCHHRMGVNVELVKGGGVPCTGKWGALWEEWKEKHRSNNS